MTIQAPVTGTREWSAHSANLITGCSHDCRYCYAKYNACQRFRRVKPEDWAKPKLRPAQLQKRYRLLDGTVMFPTTHDILPKFLDECVVFAKNILRPGNRMLIVSKPHLECIKRLCTELLPWKDKILFRFSIGADDDRILGWWEPGAPGFAERLASLKFAYLAGLETSVSVEPMLDSPNVNRLVSTLLPYVTDSIWIGKLNGINTRVIMNGQASLDAVARIKNDQTDLKIREIYATLKGLSTIKWKESIKRVVGIELNQEVGLDA